MPREYLNQSGQIVLDYAKAIQESVFEQLRVVRDGQLRIVFSQDLKVGSSFNRFCEHNCTGINYINIHKLILFVFARFVLGSFVLGIMKSSSLEDL